jgi:hypothetical protein
MRISVKIAAIAAVPLVVLLVVTLVPIARAASGPTVASVKLFPLAPGELLLRQEAEIVLSNSIWQLGVTGWEWAWADKANAPAPTSRVMRGLFSPKGQTGVHISYYWTKPNIKATLFVRGVDPNGVGNWYRFPQTIRTPKVPVLVALGDSITSGHHRDTGETTTRCWDTDYGYPRRVLDKINAYLPSQWKALYTNVAESGFDTTDVIRGGPDACNEDWPSPMRVARDALKAHSPSWNQVMMTLGVDNTNWDQVVRNIVTDKLLRPYLGDDLICSSRISEWDGWGPIRQANLTRGIERIYSTLHQADDTAIFYHVGYYNPSGSGYDFQNFVGPLFPGACAPHIDNAIEALHSAITKGIDRSGAPVLANLDETGQALSFKSDMYQELQTNPLVPLPGWPHPNSVGAEVLANAIPLFIPS